MVSCNNEERADSTRMISDLKSAWVEVLSARCATDRLRLRYSPQQVARTTDRATLNRTIEAVGAMCSYFSEVQGSVDSE